MFDDMTVGLSLRDIEVLKDIVMLFDECLNDEELSDTIRNKYFEKLLEIKKKLK